MRDGALARRRWCHSGGWRYGDGRAGDGRRGGRGGGGRQRIGGSVRCRVRVRAAGESSRRRHLAHDPVAAAVEPGGRRRIELRRNVPRESRRRDPPRPRFTAAAAPAAAHRRDPRRALALRRPPARLARPATEGPHHERALVVLVAVPLPPVHAPPGVPPLLRRRRVRLGTRLGRGASHTQPHSAHLPPLPASGTLPTRGCTRSSSCTIN